MLAPIDHSTPVRRFSANVSQLMQAKQMALLDGLSALMNDADALLALVPPEALATRSASYTRHLVCADEHGSYSAMLLVWHPGQHSPVHGHKTWCTYKVLQGTLTEHHYHWNDADGLAEPRGAVQRRSGDVVSAPAGLTAIHRLGNESETVAVSLHVYGVERDRIATHVNLLVQAA
ncbi:cysteine dioxygenase family protein [Bordetella trematum]|uniref:cysteine dioxygenase family protein n=1 Tax=Bordetella trematum TaxID=123899 RepID=UPI000D865F03|nr:cysteine dioxygenase family protein [Bordetella trematum]SPU49448.1 Predicted metal-dependent enzyme of the double-stranded beta helix superfamily [Bordetella trematum]VDH08378.1 Predicted metal-dependent enzyme of the double-stranded beta helix superfamily [Bordetella trematum]